MARSNHLKPFHFLGLFGLMLLLQKSNAIQFTVGGAKGWTVYDNSSGYDYNQWAERTRFQVGDSLLFVYKADQDSVLQVTKDDYNSCSSTLPIASYKDGHTVFTFNRSGAFYFISGNKDNCLKNEKMVVVVLSNRSPSNTTNNDTTVASPPPSGDMGISPSPEPAAAFSPPPKGTVELNPAPAPATESHPPNAASSTFVSFTGGLFGAFFASTLISVL